MKTIVCGTDFSEPAAGAVRVAAAWARKLQCSLRLVHVIDVDPEFAPWATTHAAMDETRRTVEASAAALRAEFGIDVEAAVFSGRVHDQLVDDARSHDAQLMVVGALGRGRSHAWTLGSTADRLVQHSPVAVLIVRDPAALLDWIHGDAPLRATVCVDMTYASCAALLWSRSLQRLGRCDLELAYVAWPPGERGSAGADTPVPDAAHPWASLESRLQHELEAWASGIGIAGATERQRVLVNRGRADAALSHHAATEHSALVITGTHRRSQVARLWQGSVTRGLLHRVETNVACVPPVAAHLDAVPVEHTNADSIA